MGVLLEAKDQHLHQIGSTELALAFDTARFSGQHTRPLFQHPLQLLSYLFYPSFTAF